MPPVIMTNVMPSAITPTIEEFRNIAMILFIVAKRGAIIEHRINIKINTGIILYSDHTYLINRVNVSTGVVLMFVPGALLMKQSS